MKALDYVRAVKWAYNDISNEKVSFKEMIDKCNDKILQDIASNLKISEYQNLILFKYNENMWKEGFWNLYDGLYRDCRGVVIDIDNECEVLTPFTKFFNMNELPEVSRENIEKKIQEAIKVEFSNKLDGSLMSARYYQGKIIMASSGSLIKENCFQLEDAYSMLNDSYIQMMKSYPNRTFMFEFISHKDAHVVIYKNEGLYLIGMKEHGYQYPYEDIVQMARKFGILTTTTFNLSLDEVLDICKTIKGEEQEGFVARIETLKDVTYIKIKSEDYLKLHKLIGEQNSINTIIQHVANNSLDDILAHLSSTQASRIRDKAKVIYNYKDQMEAKIKEYTPTISDRKEAMIWINENVPKFIQSFVRNAYLGKSYDILKPLGLIKMSTIEENLKLLEQLSKEEQK